MQTITPAQQDLLRKLHIEHPTHFARIVGTVGAIDSLTRQAASEAISAIFLASNGGEYRAGSKQAVMEAALRANDMDIQRALNSLAPTIGVEKPLIFRGKWGGRSDLRPFPMGGKFDRANVESQWGRARKTAFAVKAELAERDRQKGEQKPEQQEQKQEQKQDEQRIEQKEQQSPSLKAAQELLHWITAPFVTGQHGLRAFCKQRAADGHPIDEIGLRPAENGAKMLRQGIPVNAIKHALTMHFPPEARKALGVKDFNVLTFKPAKFDPIPAEQLPQDVLKHDGKHKALAYCMALVAADVPIMLTGPKGTGKTTLGRHIAEELGRPFGMVSMTAGTSPSAFNGRPRISDPGTSALISALIANGKEDQALKVALRAHKEGDVVVSQFVRCYGSGGVFLFDEMDAADENLLLLLNAALANGHFANSATGEIIERHPEFVPIAGMNTMGVGATRDYNSRNKLDAATLDRWNAGRVKVELDEALERKLYWSVLAA